MPTVRGVAWDQEAQRLCRLARRYGHLFGAEYVGTEHLLLAAAEVTPADRHGCPALTFDGVLAGLERAFGVRDVPELHERLPERLTPAAVEVLRVAVDRATAAGRPVGGADLWAGLLADPGGIAGHILSCLADDPEDFLRRLRSPAAGPDRPEGPT